MQSSKTVIRYAVLFSLTAAVLVGLLVLAALVPKGAIRENTRVSAEFLCENPVFFPLVEGIESSTIDRYADSILLNIAYHYDASQPLSSVMRSAYYFTDVQNENENLLDAVTDDLPANQQYLRYWHGSNVLVRPLLAVLTLPQIYVLNGVLLALLAVALVAVLLKKRARAAAFGVGLGLVLVGAWYVPFSLEYTWTVLLALAGALVLLALLAKHREKQLGAFFLLLGMLTCYFDFLTTETLTLLLPLLLLLWFTPQGEPKQLVRRCGGAVLLWGIGYVGFWCLKWLLAAWVLGENTLPYVTQHVEERLSGSLVGVGPAGLLLGAVTRNLACLFPWEYGPVGAAVGLALLVFGAYVGYVYHKTPLTHEDKTRILLYSLLALVPYLRYLVLHNHAYLHCFFTYRAQLATVLAVVLLLAVLTEGRWCPGAAARKRKP